MLIISHNSALRFYRSKSLRCASDENLMIPGGPHPLATSEERDARALLPEPIDALLFAKDQRIWRKGFSSKVCRASFSLDAFRIVSPGIYVVSPELLFLELARLLDHARLIKIGFELCGCYMLDSHEACGFRQRLPLTNAKRMDAFLREAREAGHPGCKKALGALSYVADGAASPMESVITILLSLPRMRGGYGLPLPELNIPLKKTSTQQLDGASWRAGMKRRHGNRICDLIWRDKRISLEYDSDMFHSGTGRIAQDAYRRNEIALTNVKTYTATKTQVYDQVLFDDLAHQLSIELGVRWRMPSQKALRAREELRCILLRKSHDGTVAPETS